MKSTQTTTRTRVRTETELQSMREALRQVELTAEEETVLRLRYGVGEAADAPLRFRGQTHDQSRVKLAMAERDLLNEARERVIAPEIGAHRDRLLDKLRRYGDDI